MASIRVSAKPRSGKDAILGVRAGLLLVSVTAAAEGGKANTAIERVIADAAGVAKSTVRVVRGHTARVKTVELGALTEDAVATMMQAFPQL